MTQGTDVKHWVEVYEYQRKSAIVWRAPFLANDPPPFEIIKGHSTSKYTASYSLQTLHEYQLPSHLVWDGEWSILVEPGKTDEEGWSYAMKFDSSQYGVSPDQCCFVRKRKYIRDYKKGVENNNATQSNIGKAATSSNTPQVWFSVTEQPLQHNSPSMTEHIIFEVETRDLMSRNWKPYNALWFTPEMKPLHIVKPHELPLPSATSKGEWMWAEGWSILLPTSENMQSSRTMHDENNPMTDSLKSLKLLMPESKKTVKKGLSSSGGGGGGGGGNNTPSLTPLSPSSDAGDFALNNNEREDSKFVKMMRGLTGNSEQKEESKKSGGFGNKLKSMMKIDNSRPRKNSQENSVSREASKNKSRETSRNKSPETSKIKGKTSKKRSEKDDDESSQSRESVASSISRPNSIHDDLDDHMAHLETFDRNGWTYCHKLATEPFRWKSTDSPSQRHVYRRRAWVRAAVWQPKTSSRIQSERSGPPDSNNTGIPVDTSEYLMTELLSGLIWHVHLMSHENIINTLPKDGLSIDKEALGKFNAIKELASGNHIEYRKFEDATGNIGNSNSKNTNENSNSNNVAANDRSDTKGAYTTKIADMTKSVVVGTISTLRGGQKIFIFQRVTELFFVEDVVERALKLGDLMAALKGLQFHYEPLKGGDTRSTLTQHLQSGGPIDQAGTVGLCDKLFELLADVLSECTFHSSSRPYADSERSRLLHDLAEIGKLYTNVKKSKSVSNISQLVMLLQSYIRSIHKGKSDYESEGNPIWIIDDLFHVKKKLAALRLDPIQQLCLFFPDLLTNMRHVSWILRRFCEERKELDELNTKLCQLQFQRGQKTLEQWLKCLHDSVRPHVVAELITLYIETNTSKEDLSGKQHVTSTDYTELAMNCLKISALNAYSKIRQQYGIGSILDGLSQPIGDSNTEPVTENQTPKEENITTDQGDNAEHSIKKEEKEDEAREPTETNKNDPKKNTLDLLEYFNDERKKKEWPEFLEEIQLLTKEDSNLSIALWKLGICTDIPAIGMETLGSKFATDIITLLETNKESLESAYRLLLTGAHQFQLMLQKLCYKYSFLEIEKENKELNIGAEEREDQEDTTDTKKTQPVERVIPANFDELFKDNAFIEEIKQMDESETYKKVNELFSFVKMEMADRLQMWMKKSLKCTIETIDKAVKEEKWDSSLTREQVKSGDQDALEHRSYARGRSYRYFGGTSDDVDERDNTKITWANFIADSFSLIGNEINTYFLNIESFPPEAMETANQFYGNLFLLIKYLLKISSNAFAEFVELPKSSNNPISLPPAFDDETLKNIDKEITANDEDREVFSSSGLAVSTVQDGIKELSNILKEIGIQNIFTFIKGIDKLEIGDDVHVLEEAQFKKELKYMCVKLSSVSRVIEMVGEFGQKVLQRIQDMKEPKEPYLKETYENYRMELIQSAYQFVAESKEIAKNSLRRTVAFMAAQCIDIQNQHYFSFGLYKPTKIESTTAIKSGLLERLFDFLSRCDNYLRYKDLRVLCCCLATYYAKRIREALVGRTPRTYRIQDSNILIKDFDEVFGLFASFDAVDFDRERRPLDNEEHPLNPYYYVLQWMKASNSDLFHQHVLVMAERSETEGPTENKIEQKETEKERPKNTRNDKNKQQQQQSIVSRNSFDKTRQKNYLKRGQDHLVLHVLVHRLDEDAQAYVENFVQYHDKHQSLLTELYNMGGTLRVIVHSGRNLAPTNSSHMADPYVTVTIQGITKSTRVVRRSLNPTWQQALDFDLSDDILKAIKKTANFWIRFEVTDWDPTADSDFIGQHKMKITLNQQNVQQMSLELHNEQNTSSGPQRGELLVTVELENIWNSLKIIRDEEHVVSNTSGAQSNHQKKVDEPNSQNKQKRWLGWLGID